MFWTVAGGVFAGLVGFSLLGWVLSEPADALGCLLPLAAIGGAAYGVYWFLF